MNLIKKYILLIIILVLYMLFALGISFLNSNDNNNLIINNNTIWHYKNKKWINIPISEFSSLKLNGYKLYDTSDNDILGKYDLKYNNNWSIKKNNDKNYSLHESQLFAYKGNRKFAIIDFEEKDLDENDKNIVSTFMTNKSLGSINNLDYSSKISIDYNNDGNIEVLYTLSNMYTEIYTNKYFSIIFVYNDDKYDILEEIELLEDNLSLKNDSIIYKIIDITGDGKYEIITENMWFGRPDDCKYSMYQLNSDNKYELVISNRR